MICIPITAKTNDEAINDLREASRFADIVELRIDYIKEPDLNALLKSKTKPVIVTNRSLRQGGLFEGDEIDRMDLLKKAINLKAEFVDVEYDCLGKIADKGVSKIIASYHDFSKTPDDLPGIHASIVKSGADIVKIVTFATDIRDNFKMFELLKATGFPTIAFCMGELGQISRILTTKFGGRLTFASLGKGKESAPGQLTIDDCKNVYRISKLNEDTDIYGLLGDPVSHSMGPHIHNASFDAVGINAVYVPFKVEAVSSFLEMSKKLDIKGLSVTIPHKETSVNFLDNIDVIAKNIGAVNTIVNRNGKLTGHNTDCPAAINSLSLTIINAVISGALKMAKIEPSPTGGSLPTLKDRKVVILGAGGAARAIAFGIKDKGASITIVNRVHQRAENLAAEAGCQSLKMHKIHKCEIDVLINTTSVGMHPEIDESPVPSYILKKGMVVFDIVYNPPETKLLKEARERGCIVLNGVKMFVKQAAMQFELFTGQRAPVKLMEDIIRKRING